MPVRVPEVPLVLRSMDAYVAKTLTTRRITPWSCVLNYQLGTVIHSLVLCSLCTLCTDGVKYSVVRSSWELSLQLINKSINRSGRVCLSSFAFQFSSNFL
jgi:hypothetical protein